MTKRNLGNAALAVFIGVAAMPATAQEMPNYRMNEISVGDPVIFNGRSCSVTAVKPIFNDRSVMDNMTIRCSNGSIYQPMANVSMVQKGGGGAAVAAKPAPARSIAHAAPAMGGLSGSARQAIEHYYRSATVEWQSLQLGAPRTISPRDAVPLEIRGGTTVYPALAKITTNSYGTIRDIVQTFYVYKDEFGNWVAAPYASGAVSSQTRGEYGH